MKEKTQIDLSEFEDFLRLIELQRELTYHLHQFELKAIERNNELKTLLSKAQRLAQLKGKFKQIAKPLRQTLPDDVVKEINRLMFAKKIEGLKI